MGAWPELPGHEAKQQHAADGERRQISGSVQPRSLPLMTAQTTPEQSGRRQGKAAKVQSALRTEGLIEAEIGKKGGKDAHRHVEPEDPVPVHALGNGATDDGPDGDGKATDTAPGTQRQRSALSRHTGRQDGQRQRRDDRAADALRRAGKDQHRAGGRKGGCRRANRKDDQAEYEDAPPAEAVAEGGAGQQQHGERQRVGVDGPLELLQGRAQLGPNDRQGGGHHQVVERDHEQRNRRYGEGPGRR